MRLRGIALSRSTPCFRGVWQSRTSDDDADAVIAETVAWFKARNAPLFFWWLDPQATPADMGARLLAHGFAAWVDATLAFGIDARRGDAMSAG